MKVVSCLGHLSVEVETTGLKFAIFGMFGLSTERFLQFIEGEGRS